jgi:ubiquinone/menaquinone biosynthesis C-methylase UbiE
MKNDLDAKHQARIAEEIMHHLRAYDEDAGHRTLMQSNSPGWRFMEGQAWRLIRAMNEGRGPYSEVAAYQVERCGGGRVLSVGSGTGEQEIGIARSLEQSGTPYEITCLDLNSDLIARGRDRANADGLHMIFKVEDVDYVRLGDKEFDVILCFSSLHRLVNLEHVFHEMKRSLKASGELVVVDIIVRNGFLMWDETYQIVQDIWKLLPEQFKMNFTAGAKLHFDLEYPHFNQGLESMEYVRSEDIVPLLDQYFARKLYVPYFSIARRLCGTMYGPCYDLSRDLDKSIVTMIWQLDVYFLECGKLAPETFLGIYTKGKVRSRPEREDIESNSLQRPSQSTMSHVEPAIAAKKKRVLFYRGLGARKGDRVESGVIGPNEEPIKGEPFITGHFYSALPSTEDRQAYVDAERKDDDVPGIDLNLERQLALLLSFQPYYDEAPFTAEESTERRFFYENGFYSYADALTLYSMMREFKPRRIIEIGSGYSSAVMLDTNEIHFNNAIELTFVEPFPHVLFSLMRGCERQRASVPTIRAQDLDQEIFTTLDRNDILFVDSTHVTKLRSDVNKIFFDILPVLKSGVLIHFHDIFWPFDYPKEMVRKGIAWNEAYLLRAFLQFNTSFEIVLFANLLHERHKDWLGEHMPLYLKNAGGNIWLRKK